MAEQAVLRTHRSGVVVNHRAKRSGAGDRVIAAPEHRRALRPCLRPDVRIPEERRVWIDLIHFGRHHGRHLPAARKVGAEAGWKLQRRVRHHHAVVVIVNCCLKTSLCTAGHLNAWLNLARRCRRR